MSTIKTRRQAKAVADDAATTIAISIPDDVDPDTLAALLPGISLDSPSPDNILALYRLVMEQADEIDAKQQSIDEARADIEKKDVELDQALQDKETLSSDLDSQIQTLQDELKEVKSERDKLRAWRLFYHCIVALKQCCSYFSSRTPDADLKDIKLPVCLFVRSRGTATPPERDGSREEGPFGRRQSPKAG